MRPLVRPASLSALLLTVLALIWVDGREPTSASLWTHAARATSRHNPPDWQKIGYAEHAGNDWQSSRTADDWVRTTAGWEHRSSWSMPHAAYQPQLHPAVISALISLSALWLLLAFPAEEQPNPTVGSELSDRSLATIPARSGLTARRI